MTDLLILGACAIVYLGVAVGIAVALGDEINESGTFVAFFWPITLPIGVVAWLVVKGARWVLR